MKMKFSLSASAFLLCLSFAKADILASWDFKDVDLDEVEFAVPFKLPSPNLGAGVAGAELSLGSGVNPSTTNSRYGFKVSSGSETNNLNDAVLANHFIQFNIKALPGSFLNLSFIDLVARSTGTGSSDVAVVASLAGFAEGTMDGVTLATRSGVNNSSPYTIPLDLSGSDYQNISSVAFRLYGWGTSGGSGVTHLLDQNTNGVDLVINGTTFTAIPEISSTLPLAGLFSLSVLGFRKRRT